jgi:hypothetical protein
LNRGWCKSYVTTKQTHKLPSFIRLAEFLCQPKNTAKLLAGRQKNYSLAGAKTYGLGVHNEGESVDVFRMPFERNEVDPCVLRVAVV